MKFSNGKRLKFFVPITVGGVLLTCLVIVYAQQRRAPAGEQQRPRTVAARTASSGGRTINVKPKDNLQSVLDAAQLGDEIVLEAGSVYRGAFVLRRKTGEGWITIRSSRLAELPGDGVRVTPLHAALMPKLAGKSGAAVITTEEGAHHYRLVGIEVMPETTQTFLYNLIQLGSDSQTSLEQIPHHIIIDRCYIHGHSGYPTRRGIALNSAHTEVINSYLSEFKEQGADSQAIAGWTGSGNYKIINNYLEAAGENVLFGGNDPRIPGLVPSDIEVSGNHLFKPLRWKQGEASYDGKGWTVKNLFELKNARRVRVDGNLMENNWAQAQNGYGILFTVRNQGGTAPWSTIEDIEFTNNVVRNSAHGVNILGRDDLQQSGQAKGILIRNNLFEMRRGGELAGDFLQLTDADDISVVQNTVVMGWAFKAYGKPTTKFNATDNLFMGGGMHGAGMGGGTAMLAHFLPRAVIRGNVFGWMNTLEHEYDGQMRGGNRFTPKLGDAEFVNAAKGDYRLAQTSRLKSKKSEMKDVGCDFDALQNAFKAATPPLN